MEFKFKRDYPDFSQRKAESDKIREKFPEKIPVICEKDPYSYLRDIEKTKYLVPSEITVNNFHLMIRKRIEIPEEEGFYLLVNGKFSITGERLLSDVYEQYKDKEGFLYILYTGELIWGNRK